MLLFLVKKLKDKDIQYQEEGRIVWHTMYCIETLMENLNFEEYSSMALKQSDISLKFQWRVTFSSPYQWR